MSVAVKNKIVIGLTGSFGTGKSTVAKIFQSLGAKVIDADEISHQLIRPGKSLHKRIFQEFGREVFSSDGSVDRKKLGELVFANPRTRMQLEKLMHPEIIKEIKKQIRICRKRIVVLDAPLLIEAGLTSLADKLVVVVTSELTQKQRSLRRDSSLTSTQIKNRLDAQIPLIKKLPMADFIIDNDKQLSKTKQEVRRIWQIIKCRKS